MSRPIDLKRLQHLVDKYGEVYLDQEDKLKHDLKFDFWYQSNIALGLVFILSLIGSLGLFITIVSCSPIKQLHHYQHFGI